WDRYGETFSGASAGADLLSASGAAGRGFRGGSWHFNPLSCRSAFRNGDAPVYRGGGLGFRLARGQAGHGSGALSVGWRGGGGAGGGGGAAAATGRSEGAERGGPVYKSSIILEPCECHCTWIPASNPSPATTWSASWAVAGSARSGRRWRRVGCGSRSSSS